MTDMSHRQLST